ncbi:3-hydroxybutyrate dehydrogenase [Candidatus Phycorickettsia trachydisci]|uniref:3-hydroxybutyrate dehydrogenase n=1 Tax=Candidatus Phycorickettsia trachydisci TaxID=2115978 RepID=A0A2P1P9Y2_9RICK|nr:3-hydroxybutyrate dehydrogenase [Candidatus Phycorickettsia trachydisci]AVP88069.1 3-hydroxybutyrate dehydrogenase [Candidatus Phycorickettsia trachydisci]
MLKTAIVTGATSGIGLEVAKALAANGNNIIINGFGKPEEIQNAVNSIQEHGVRCKHYNCDQSDPAQIKSMISQGLEEFGQIDILVNNAGIQKVSPIEDFPEDKWEAIIRINLIAAFYTIKGVIPSMKKNGWGRIVNIASAHGLAASPNKSAYVSAKHGIVGLTKTVALEVATNGITVNSICPGYVDTPLVRGQIPDQARVNGVSEKEALENIILAPHAIKQLIHPSEIASLAVYLCSDAAKSITGTALPIDCGWTAR